MKFRSANREERKMLFPKPQTKKKRKKHRESLLQNKESRIATSAPEGGIIAGRRCLKSTTSLAAPIDIYLRSMD